MNKHVYTDLIKDAINRFPDKSCFHIKRDGKYRSWSFSDFHHNLNQLVSQLKRIGIDRNINAMVIGDNTPEWVIAFHAIILAGGQTVPVDPSLPPNEIKEIFRITSPRVVFCTSVFRNLFSGIADANGNPLEIVILPSARDNDALPFETFLKQGSADADAFGIEFSPDDNMVILFTSGTTGKAKGAVLCQRNYTTASLYGVPRMKLDAKERVLAILPLHHVFGFAACIAAELPSGIDVVFLPQIKGPLIVEALKDMGVTMLPAVPQMVELFNENIKRNVKAKGLHVRFIFQILGIISSVFGSFLGMGFRRKLFSSVHKGFGGRLNLIISGGSSLRAEPFRAFRNMGFSIVEGYGLTETFGPITICPIEDRRLGSVGPVFPENEMKIFEPNEHGIGEVLFRGATVFKGYYQNEVETRKVFDSDGWFHTGDLGRVTKDGFLYLTGRLKDVIVLESGKNVYPDEIEAFYQSSNCIEEIGVVGFPRGSNEVAVAVIVPSKEIRKRYGEEDAEAIIRGELVRMGRNLPSYKKVSDFLVSYHPLPRTSTRKIRKPELRKFFLSSRDKLAVKSAIDESMSVTETELMKSSDFKAVADFISGLSRELQSYMITPRSSLEIDLAMDSLRKIELAAWLEKRFRMTLDDSMYARLETVGDVMLLIQENRDHGSVNRDTRSHARLGKIVPESKPGLVFRGGLLTVRALSRLFWNFKIINVENVPINENVIFCSNHESYLDAVWILSSLPKAVRENTFVIGKAELLKHSLLAILLAHINVIAVDREGDVLTALKAAETALRSGKSLLIFPEGTRTRTGRMGRFRSGIGELMLRTGRPAIPVRIKGAFQIWPANKFPRLFGMAHAEASVRFGEPVVYETLARDAAVFGPEQAVQKVREQVIAL